MFLLECDARHHFAVPVVELYGIRKKLCINRTSFLCFWQLELKGKISDEQMSDLITSYTAICGPPPAELGT